MGTKIEWAEESWNPITGCTPISPGCANCYAKRMANRLRGRYGYPADDPFRPTFHPDRLDQPAKWKKPRRIFVCSMGDLFHDQTFDGCMHSAVFETMGDNPDHTYMLLTKRPERMREAIADWKNLIERIPNLYLGVTVESNEQLWRVDELLKLRDYAKVLFVSAEPLLGEIYGLPKYLPYSIEYANSVLNQFPNSYNSEKYGLFDATKEGYESLKAKLLSDIDWVIAGGESGPGARPSHPDWFRKIRDDCRTGGVPFFFKGWGERKPVERQEMVNCALNPNHFEDWQMRTFIDYERVGKQKASNLLDGVKHEEMPGDEARRQ